MRQLAPELLLTARTQRWKPEEVLRSLVEAEIASRDASNTRARLKAATFPVIKTIEEFDLTASSIPSPIWNYLTRADLRGNDRGDEQDLEKALRRVPSEDRW